MSVERPSAQLHHLAMAEQGKVLALQGKHVQALERYRAALLLARRMSAPAVFARHYTDCIFESLERSGQLGPALELCAAACAEMGRVEAPTPLQARDQASMLLRRGALLIRLDRAPEAEEILQEAMRMAEPGRLPLAEELLAWLRQALYITRERLTEAQERHGYYTVRRDALRPELARLAASFAPTTGSAAGGATSY